MIFKPDADGRPEQRIFHLQSMDPATGEDVAEERMLFEIRIRDGQWCLDSFATSGGQRLPLLNCEKRYPFGKWYRVTTVYDGKILKNYVGDELQGEGDVHLFRNGRGICRWECGLILWIITRGRFTRRGLRGRHWEWRIFLKMPAKE